MLPILKYWPLLPLLVAAFVPSFRGILWACRVSVVSALGGYFLFVLVLQAQDLFADTTLGHEPLAHIAKWSWMFFLLALVWALPVHIAARDAVEDRGWRDRVATYTPRVLGVLPVIGVMVGILGAAVETRGAAHLEPGLTAQFVLLSLGAWVTLGVLIAYFVARKALASYVNDLADLPGYRWAIALRNRLAGPGDSPDELTLGDAILVLAALVTFTLFVLLCLFPIPMTYHFAPRAALIPILFGSPVLFLSALAKLSDDTRQPWLVGALVALTVVGAFNQHFNDVRLLPETAALPPQQTDLSDAVDAWRTANGCGKIAGQDDKKTVASCPPPLLIASEGGASRAAYYTAAVVGELLDEIRQSKPAEALGPVQSDNPARSLFALSGVSGGALGVATVQAALLDTERDPPCANKSLSWRGCLEALVEGDYLSPTFVGLGLRDQLGPLSWPLGDRAALLERSWEAHYLRTTLGQGENCDSIAEPVGLCRALARKRKSDRWTPLLMLNGTSVQSGRRIIASDLKPRRNTQTLHDWSYDLYEMLSEPCTPTVEDYCASDAPTPKPSGRNVRLSTGALLSARFPLVSPAGNIWSSDGQHGDSVVDGGYFENSGQTSAREVAAALADLGLHPIVLSISNGKSPVPGATGKTRVSVTGCQVPLTSPQRGLELEAPMSSAENLWFRAASSLLAPIESLYNTRDSHAEISGVNLTEALHNWDTPSLAPGSGADDLYASFFPLRVYPKGETADKLAYDMPDLSMSWWLSPVVRKALDNQLNNVFNKLQMCLVTYRLGHAGMPPPQPPASRTGAKK